MTKPDESLFSKTSNQFHFSKRKHLSHHVLYINRPLTSFTRSCLLNLLPLMVDTEAGQPGDGLSLHQIFQTDGALAAVFTQHIRCECKDGPERKRLRAFQNAATDVFR